MALGLSAALAACGDDDDRRDQFYGTDVGVDYQLPDGNLDRISDTGTDAREAGAPEVTPGEDGPAGGSPDAAPFQETGEAADAETGG